MLLFSILGLLGCTEQPLVSPLCAEDPGQAVALDDAGMGISAEDLADAVSDTSFDLDLYGTGGIVPANTGVQQTWTVAFTPDEATHVDVAGPPASNPASQCQVGTRLDVTGTVHLESTGGVVLDTPGLLTTWSDDPGEAWLSFVADPTDAMGPDVEAVANGHTCSDGSPIEELTYEALGRGFDFDPTHALGASPLFGIQTTCGEALLQGSGTWVP